MAINTLVSNYTQTSSSQSVNIPNAHNPALLVSVDGNFAPTFNGVSLSSATSYNGNANFFWFIMANPSLGSFTLAPTGGSTILNYFIVDNVDPVTPLSTQISVPAATFNAYNTVYLLSGDGSTLKPTWFGVAYLIYPGGSPIDALSITGGTILNQVGSPTRVAFMKIPSISTANPYSVTYSTTGSGAFSCPSPAWVFLKEILPPPAVVQMIII